MDTCPDCGVHVLGGWVQRRREVIDLPPPTIRVIEHQFVARTFPLCRKRVTPPASGLDGLRVGRQR
ncbi:MAG: IS66 family transposase zinc-finger binding domain-containing protein [Dehalococcoidia bacterium]